jgi:non-ribosomal peptide synthase protein (TIGR01720 family)
LTTELFEIAEESEGRGIGESFISEYKLDINGIITNKQFSISIAYDNFEFDKRNMKRFSHTFKKILLEIIEHCKTKDTTTITPSDISDEDFDIESLNEFLLDFSERSN